MSQSGFALYARRNFSFHHRRSRYRTILPLKSGCVQCVCWCKWECLLPSSTETPRRLVHVQRFSLSKPVRSSRWIPCIPSSINHSFYVYRANIREVGDSVDSQSSSCLFRTTINSCKTAFSTFKSLGEKGAFVVSWEALRCTVQTNDASKVAPVGNKWTLWHLLLFLKPSWSSLWKATDIEVDLC